MGFNVSGTQTITAKESIEAPAKYSGADWLRDSIGIEPSALGAEVADIMGQAWRGLYHMGRRDLSASTWADPHCVEVRLGWVDLATFDRGFLTELVVLCHDRCIRLSIEARARRYLTLQFHKRRRTGGLGERHPTIEQAVASIRGGIGLGVVE